MDSIFSHSDGVSTQPGAIQGSGQMAIQTMIHSLTLAL